MAVPSGSPRRGPDDFDVLRLGIPHLAPDLGHPGFALLSAGRRPRGLWPAVPPLLVCLGQPVQGRRFLLGVVHRSLPAQEVARRWRRNNPRWIPAPTGRDAAWLASTGHDVLAVEPS